MSSHPRKGISLFAAIWCGIMVLWQLVLVWRVRP
jgi:hypothetical protein